jgi:hypothetical protein
MRFPLVLITFCLCLSSQPPPKEQASENKGMPPRASAADYQAHERAGAVTIAADFAEHSITTPQGPLSTDDYVVVEVALYAPAGTHAHISIEDFSLRINGKKSLPSQPYGMVLGNVKDPEWEPPESASASKSKTSLNSGGSGQQPDSGPPPPVHIPIEVQHAMAQKVQKAAIPEGDRALPQAGMIFFRYGGKPKSIHSVELIYSGSAGKATLTLQP